MTDPPDDHLWRLAAAGDADAFGRIYERHDRAVHAYCLVRVGDQAAAEDLTSVTFLEAWRAVATTTLRHESARPRLFGIATNVVRHQWRSRRRHAAALGRLGRIEEVRPGHDDDAGARLEAVDRLEALRGQLAALPRREREVLALVALADLSYAETATALGLPVGTVRSRLSRARARLEPGAPAALASDPATTPSPAHSRTEASS